MSQQKHQPSQIWVYTTGFILSLVLTMAAYVSVTSSLFTGSALAVALLGLAVLQLAVQLIFFLHMDSERKPRLNLVAFLFMLLVLLIVVIGSLWIMKHLDYHMMSPEETDTFIQHDEGISK